MMHIYHNLSYTKVIYILGIQNFIMYSNSEKINRYFQAIEIISITITIDVWFEKLSKAIMHEFQLPAQLFNAKQLQMPPMLCGKEVYKYLPLRVLQEAICL